MEKCEWHLGFNALPILGFEVVSFLGFGVNDT